MTQETIRYQQLKKEGRAEAFKAMVKAKGMTLPKGYATMGAEKFTKFFFEVNEAPLVETVEEKKEKEVVEQKKSVQPTGKSTEAKFKYFVEFQEYNYEISQLFLTFLKKFPNKKLKTNGYVIDTKNKTVSKDEVLIYKHA